MAEWCGRPPSVSACCSLQDTWWNQWPERRPQQGRSLTLQPRVNLSSCHSSSTKKVSEGQLVSMAHFSWLSIMAVAPHWKDIIKYHNKQGQDDQSNLLLWCSHFFNSTLLSQWSQPFQRQNSPPWTCSPTCPESSSGWSAPLTDSRCQPSLGSGSRATQTQHLKSESPSSLCFKPLNLILFKVCSPFPKIKRSPYLNFKDISY